MGSGPSKNKDTSDRISPRNTPRKVESSPAKVNSNSKQTSESVTKSNSRISEPLKPALKPSEFGHKQHNGNTNKLDRNDNTTKSRIPQPFEESSDDEGDDLLNDQWKNKNKTTSYMNNNTNDSYQNNTTKTWEPPKPPEQIYPETYAQKMQREQYKRDQLLRQKTIYRDPEEWEIDQSNKTQNSTESNVSQQSFDVSKFKEANKTMPKTDIFGPVSNNDYSFRTQIDDDNYYQTTNYNRKKSVPKYDVSEEELMNDIETNYY